MDSTLSSDHGYTSLALRDIPIPDYCDVVIVPTRGVRLSDPAQWAQAIFSHENATLTSRGVKALRDEALRMFDLVPPPTKHKVVSEVVGSEALIVDDTPHLSTRIGVAVEPGGELLRITTAVRYRSIAGRLTFGPRRMMHAAAVHSLAKRAPVTLRRAAALEIEGGTGPTVLGVGRLPRQQRAQLTSGEARDDQRGR